MTQNRFSILLPLLFMMTFPMLGGCDRSSKHDIVVYRYPENFHPGLKTVAVLPFASRCDDRNAGERLSDKVSAKLTRNKTYQVFNRANLREIMNEKDLAEAGIIDSETAMEIGRLKSVQALICGICNRYDVVSETHTEMRQKPKVRTLPNGQVRVDTVTVPVRVERNEVTIECQVVVIDAVTGLQISAVSEPITKWSKGVGEPAEHSIEQLCAAAEEDQVNLITKSIAIVPIELKLEGKPIRTATSGIGSEYDWEDDFMENRESFLAVVELPRDADRNAFRIVVTPKKTMEILYEDEFVWDKRMKRMDRTVRIKPLLEKHGTGDYKIHLYCGDQPAASRKFKIKELKEDD